MHSRRIKLLALAALAAWWRLPDLAHGDPYPPVDQKRMKIIGLHVTRCRLIFAEKI
jgi:hypothetical protein